MMKEKSVSPKVEASSSRMGSMRVFSLSGRGAFAGDGDRLASAVEVRCWRLIARELGAVVAGLMRGVSAGFFGFLSLSSRNG